MRSLCRVVTALVLLAAPAPGFAHALLQRAEPSVGGTVRSPPAQVALTFTEAVEPLFSTVTVADAAGRRVDKGDVHAAGEARRLAVSLVPLVPGVYTVTWHATSVDTHKTEGSFSFTVAP